MLQLWKKLLPSKDSHWSVLLWWMQYYPLTDVGIIKSLVKFGFQGSRSFYLCILWLYVLFIVKEPSIPSNCCLSGQMLFALVAAITLSDFWLSGFGIYWNFSCFVLCGDSCGFQCRHFCLLGIKIKNIHVFSLIFRNF